MNGLLQVSQFNNRRCCVKSCNAITANSARSEGARHSWANEPPAGRSIMLADDTRVLSNEIPIETFHSSPLLMKRIASPNTAAPVRKSLTFSAYRCQNRSDSGSG
jgi:hypothetical protein